VLGCLAVALLIVCVGPVFAIPAVVCGHMAFGRIKRSNGLLGGEGMALAGLITGYVSLGLSVILIPLLGAIALPNFVKARHTAQQNACINNLRMIDGAKQSLALEKSKTADDEPTGSELTPYLRMSFNQLRCPEGGTYAIGKIGRLPTCSIPNHRLPAPSGPDFQAETQ